MRHINPKEVEVSFCISELINIFSLQTLLMILEARNRHHRLMMEA